MIEGLGHVPEFDVVRIALTGHSRLPGIVPNLRACLHSIVDRRASFAPHVVPQPSPSAADVPNSAPAKRVEGNRTCRRRIAGEAGRPGPRILNIVLLERTPV